MNSRVLSTTSIRSAFKLTKMHNSISSKVITFNLHQNVNPKAVLPKNVTHNHCIPLYNAVSRSIHTKIPRTPDLIYVPHILRWLKTKYKLKLLQKTWDPEFTEGSFIYGTSRAICRITEIIHENKLEQLRGLLTTAALIKLREDLTSKISKVQKIIIKIRPEDIKILVPMSVVLNKDREHRNCRIAMRVLALKWIQHNGVLRLVLIALQTEFLRDYTPNVGSDWTISGFDILECTVIAKT